jgi:4-hydroxybenzoate polyprenyltransferase
LAEAVIGRVLAFIRFSHTVFALPFALGSMLVAARGWPTARVALLIVLAMVFARTAAMVFNRLADWRIDQRNPRTANRHKLISHGAAVALLVASSGAFVATASQINALCFWLCPVALLMVFFYSLTKRFTSFSHFFLGLALAVAPVGAWLAVTGSFAFAPLVLAVAVMLWVAGFDIIYATQDYEFDRDSGLRSLVVKLGISGSLRFAQWLHWIMLGVLVVFALPAALGVGYMAGLAIIAGALVYEHRAARQPDLAAINRAFFYSNAFVGCVFIAAVWAGLVTEPFTPFAR